MDGNLYALRQHENATAAHDAMEEAIEDKATDIQNILLSNKEFQSYNGTKYDLVDFYADFEVEADTLADFLNENQTYGTGQYLRGKMTEALETYCYGLAKEEIEHDEPQDEPF